MRKRQQRRSEHQGTWGTKRGDKAGEWCDEAFVRALSTAIHLNTGRRLVCYYETPGERAPFRLGFVNNPDAPTGVIAPLIDGLAVEDFTNFVPRDDDIALRCEPSDHLLDIPGS